MENQNMFRRKRMVDTSVITTKYMGYGIRYMRFVNQMVIIKGIVVLEGFIVESNYPKDILRNYAFVNVVEARKAIECYMISQGDRRKFQYLLDQYHIGYGLY